MNQQQESKDIAQMEEADMKRRAEEQARHHQRIERERFFASVNGALRTCRLCLCKCLICPWLCPLLVHGVYTGHLL
jgi:hypothetical protein